MNEKCLEGFCFERLEFGDEMEVGGRARWDARSKTWFALLIPFESILDFLNVTLYNQWLKINCLYTPKQILIDSHK